VRAIGRLIKWLLGLSLLGGIASGVAAALARGRMHSRGSEADDDVELVVIYNGVEFQSTATALRSLSAVCWYGGGTIDLRDATLDPSGADLSLRVIFGGFRLIVPEDWRVELSVIGIFGGVGDGRPDRARADGPVLRVSGFALFGGLGVDSEALPAAAAEA
jgi:Cell wall-active antibiotics response 4TMS YvqF